MADEQVDIIDAEEEVQEMIGEEPDYVVDAKEVKLFGKWDFSSVKCTDISLVVRTIRTTRERWETLYLYDDKHAYMMCNSLLCVER